METALRLRKTVGDKGACGGLLVSPTAPAVCQGQEDKTVESLGFVAPIIIALRWWRVVKLH